MKRLVAVLCLILTCFFVFANADAESVSDKKPKITSYQDIDKITLLIHPTVISEELPKQLNNYSKLLKSNLHDYGYNVATVDVIVREEGYDVLGEALKSGEADVAYLPSGTYVNYRPYADVILTATRMALDRDSENPSIWNYTEVFKDPSAVTNGYRALIYCDVSTKKGESLYKKLQNKKQITWDDLNSCRWALSSKTSSAGYIYPSIWLSKNYDGKTVEDLSFTTVYNSYAEAFEALAKGECDIVCCYADGRMDNIRTWQKMWGRKNNIFDDVKVIGVTDSIINDTISVRKDMDTGLKEALAHAFIDLAKDPEGLNAISVYSHTGYLKAKDSDYDVAEQVQRIFNK